MTWERFPESKKKNGPLVFRANLTQWEQNTVFKACQVLPVPDSPQMLISFSFLPVFCPPLSHFTCYVLRGNNLNMELFCLLLL